MIYAVDFDGTLSFASYPYTGYPNKPLFNYLIDAQKNGDQIILWTCRTGIYLINAIKFCKKQGLEFDAVNDNVPKVIEMFGGVNPRKVVANIYIDDCACEMMDFVKKYCNEQKGGGTRA